MSEPRGWEPGAKPGGWRTLALDRTRLGEVTKGSARRLGRHRRRLHAFVCRMIAAGRRSRELTVTCGHRIAIVNLQTRYVTGTGTPIEQMPRQVVNSTEDTVATAATGSDLPVRRERESMVRPVARKWRDPAETRGPVT